MKFMERAENWFAAALIIFFFLPWFGAGPFSVSGYSLTTIPSVLNAASASSGLRTNNSVDLLYVVWLIPILAAITLVLGLTSAKRPRAIAAVTAIVTLLMFGLVIAAGGGDTFRVMGIGSYLTILAAIGLLLAAVGLIKAPARPTATTTSSSM